MAELGRAGSYANDEDAATFFLVALRRARSAKRRRQLQRSFTVASAIAPSMAPISQKRTTTCVSVQPLRWK